MESSCCRKNPCILTHDPSQSTCRLVPHESSLRRVEDDKWALAFARIENHYFVNKGWLPYPDYLLDNVDRIRHIPGVIVQGRYDVVCPMKTSYDLHKRWPEATYEVVTAGHSATDPKVLTAVRTV
jgi:proline iminopeptidase